MQKRNTPEEVTLQPGDHLVLPDWGVKISCTRAEELINTKEIFTVNTDGPIVLRPRKAGDSIRLNAGTCTLKKLFIDRKIPAHQRLFVPVLADERGVLGVMGIGANVDRLAEGLPAMQIWLESLK
jgi:tRNA(Ile)-lysidine synthase